MPDPTIRIVQMLPFEAPAPDEEKDVPRAAVQDRARSVDVKRDERFDVQVDEGARRPDESNLLSEFPVDACAQGEAHAVIRPQGGGRGVMGRWPRLPGIGPSTTHPP